MKYPKIKWNKPVPVLSNVAEFIPSKLPDDTRLHYSFRYHPFGVIITPDTGVAVIVKDDQNEVST